MSRISNSGVGKSNKILGDFDFNDFNDVVIKLDAEIQQVQIKTTSISKLNFDLAKPHY